MLIKTFCWVCLIQLDIFKRLIVFNATFSFSFLARNRENKSKCNSKLKLWLFGVSFIRSVNWFSFLVRICLIRKDFFLVACIDPLTMNREKMFEKIASTKATFQCLWHYHLCSSFFLSSFFFLLSSFLLSFFVCLHCFSVFYFFVFLFFCFYLFLILSLTECLMKVNFENF